MNSAVGSRHQGSSGQKVPHRKKSSQKEEKATDMERSARQLLVFTIDADTAHIVKLESLDGSGARSEISEQEKASLLRKVSEGRLEEILERAFEAGISCALGDESREARPEETGEDAELRHLLLARLIDHSAIRHLMRPEALDRAILEALIQYSIKSSPADAGRETTTQSDRTAADRAN